MRAYDRNNASNMYFFYLFRIIFLEVESHILQPHRTSNERVSSYCCKHEGFGALAETLQSNQGEPGTLGCVVVVVERGGGWLWVMCGWLILR